MIEFFLAGGPAMIIITLAGGLALGAGVFFARAPTADAVPRVISLSVAVVLAIGVGTLVDLMAVFRAVARAELPTAVERFQLLSAGLSECMSPGVWGGALLTVTWLLMALGFRRLSTRQG